jgi:hypothetical protein
MVVTVENSLTGEEAVRIRAQLLRSLGACRAQEPEEIAQETLLRMLVKLRAGLHLRCPMAYSHKIAGLVLREDRRGRRRETPLGFDLIAPASDEGGMPRYA